MRTGKLEISAMFQKVTGEITVCSDTRIEGVLDNYSMVATVDPADPTKVLASFGGNHPKIPTEPVTGSIESDGKTARITAGDNWFELTWSENNTYTCQTSKIPIKITARYID